MRHQCLYDSLIDLIFNEIVVPINYFLPSSPTSLLLQIDSNKLTFTDNLLDLVDELGSLPANRYTCACGRSYSYKGDLNRHHRLECGIEPKFQCPHCPKKCKRKYHLQTHIINIHRDKLNLQN